jgi:hypothetical protein
MSQQASTAAKSLPCVKNTACLSASRRRAAERSERLQVTTLGLDLNVKAYSVRYTCATAAAGLLECG